MSSKVSTVVAGIGALAMAAHQQSVTPRTRNAWRKVCAVLEWSDEPVLSLVLVRAEETLARKPALVPKVRRILNDYRRTHRVARKKA